jgi:hypothetical protein
MFSHLITVRTALKEPGRFTMPCPDRFFMGKPPTVNPVVAFMPPTLRFHGDRAV